MSYKILFYKIRGGANSPLHMSKHLRQTWRFLSFLIAFWIISPTTSNAQLDSNPLPCPSGGSTPSWYVEIEPISTPGCGEVECNLKYFQVRLVTELTFPDTPTSFLLQYEDLSLNIKMSTVPAGGFSEINEERTEDCFPYAFQSNFPLGFEPGNEVAFLTKGDCSGSTTPNIMFTRAGVGFPYKADL